jgi:RNA polymerase sigma-70 factor (ECF subfamily)
MTRHMGLTLLIAAVRQAASGTSPHVQRDLVVRAQQGEVDAYSALTDSATTRLYAVARLILRDDDRAADAVQDTLVRAWLDIRSLRDPDRFDAWLQRILVRTCYAAAKRHRSRVVGELRLTVAGEPATSDDQAALALRDQLDRGFARLSTEHRTVLVLVHYLGLSLNDTAAAVGIPLGTVQSRLNRATAAMRAALAADERAPSPATDAVR